MKNKSSTGNRYYQGQVNDHFDGRRFFNDRRVPPPGLKDILKWRLQGSPAKWPKTVESPYANARPPERVTGDGLRVTMIGHASLLIQVAGLNILTDPVWSRRASPVQFAGPRRVIDPGVHFDNLPPIDLVLVTHNHYDHLCLETLAMLHRHHRPLIVTPLGNDTIIRRRIADASIVTLDWADGSDVGNGVRVTAEPCYHWSARGLYDRRMALWAAFVIETPAGRIYHIGDTGFGGGRNYRAAQEKYASFRLAILPIGAYEPRFVMENEHQNPDEAVTGMQLSNAAFAVGHHFGTFQLTDEAIDAPVERLRQALDRAAIDEARFRPLAPGESFDVPTAFSAP